MQQELNDYIIDNNQSRILWTESSQYKFYPLSSEDKDAFMQTQMVEFSQKSLTDKILKALDLQPIYFIFSFSLLIYSSITYLFLQQTYTKHKTNPEMLWKIKKLKEDELQLKSDMKEIFKKKRYEFRQQRLQYFMEMRRKHIEQMTEVEKDQYINRRFKRKMERQRIEDAIFEQYLFNQNTPFVKKSQIIEAKYRIHKQVGSWDIFKDDINGECIVYSQDTQSQSYLEKQWRYLQDFPESEEDRVIQKKKKIAKEYFDTSDIESDNEIYFYQESSESFIGDGAVEIEGDLLTLIKDDLQNKNKAEDDSDSVNKSQKSKIVLEFDSDDQPMTEMMLF